MDNMDNKNNLEGADGSEESFLPIGSVVKLSNNKTIQLVGYGSRKESDNKIYDYCAVPFPEGFIDGNHMFFCNNDDIEELLSMGYMDDDVIDYIGAVYEQVEEIRGREVNKNE